MSIRFLGFALVLLSAGCQSQDARTLVVNLRTDFRSGLEFNAVEVLLDGDELQRARRSVDLNESFVTPVGVAELSGVPLGLHRLELNLRGTSDSLIARQVSVVQVSSNQSVTVVVQRSCGGLTCPGADDPAENTACLAGACVPPQCLTEPGQTECPEPQCESADDCASAPSCGDVTCEGSLCYYRAEDSECPEGDYCAGDRGCVDLPPDVTLEDAGVTPIDAGSTGAIVVESVDDVHTDEGGGEHMLRVRLADAPGATVSIDLVVIEGASEVELVTTTMAFSAGNFGSIQNARLRGRDDDAFDGPQPFRLELRATSSDARYDGLVFGPIAGVNDDDEVLGRLSLATSGGEPDAESGGGGFPTIDAAATAVVFLSQATNLVAGDDAGRQDVFLVDLATRALLRLSETAGGVDANNDSFSAVLSDDGGWVAFTSYADNLVTGDSNGSADVFLHSRESGELTRLALTAGEPNDDSILGDMSGDGRFVVFSSRATNLDAADSNSRYDVYLADRNDGSVQLVSRNDAGQVGNGPSGSPISIDALAVSDDGRYVAFLSEATNLVSGDTNGEPDVFLRDVLNGTTTRLSVSTTNEQANGRSDEIGMDSTGRYVVFRSEADSLDTRIDDGTSHIFLRDTVDNATTLVTHGSDRAATGYYGAPSIDPTGRYVLFYGSGRHLISPGLIPDFQAWRWDRTTGAFEVVSRLPDGTYGDDNSRSGGISAGGRVVVFSSQASNFADDENGLGDVYVRQLSEP